MSVFRSSRTTLVVSLYGALLLALLSTAPAHNIQANSQPPTPPGLGGGPAPEATGPAPMRFQPPAGATEMADFRPAGAVMVEVASLAGQEATAPLTPSRDNLIRLASDSVGILVEAGTTPAPLAELRFRAQAAPEYAPEATLAQDGRRVLMRFEVALADSLSGAELREWQRRARIIVDLRGLVAAGRWRRSPSCARTAGWRTAPGRRGCSTRRSTAWS